VIEIRNPRLEGSRLSYDFATLEGAMPASAKGGVTLSSARLVAPYRRCLRPNQPHTNHPLPPPTEVQPTGRPANIRHRPTGGGCPGSRRS
jgi:hypothetical protein